MSEPGAEAREQAERIVETWFRAAFGSPRRPRLVEDIARALDAKDVQVAEARREKAAALGLLDGARSVIATLEADLAAMGRFIAMLAADKCTCPAVKGACGSCIARALLAPGAARVATQTAEAMPEGWRETAREVVDLLRAHHESWLRGEDGDALDAPTVALLARPEVKTWAGRFAHDAALRPGARTEAAE